MKTIGLLDAALLLKLHPQTALEKVRSGVIPGAKLGKCWVFIEEDLIEWLRSQYNRPAQDVGQGGRVCSIKEKTANTGGIASHRQTAAQYANLLKLKTEKRPRN